MKEEGNGHVTNFVMCQETGNCDKRELLYEGWMACKTVKSAHYDENKEISIGSHTKIFLCVRLM